MIRIITRDLDQPFVSKPSMVRDVIAMRRTEIDALNGAIVALGKKHNIPTPLNEALLALIKGVEAQYEKNH